MGVQKLLMSFRLGNFDKIIFLKWLLENLWVTLKLGPDVFVLELGIPDVKLLKEGFFKITKVFACMSFEQNVN